MGSKYKYTDAEIASAVEKSQSVSGAMRLLGIRLCGGNHSHIKRRIAKAGISVSHFEPVCWQRGQPSKQRHTSESILVNRDISNSSGRRESNTRLRRALIETGREYRCAGRNCTVIDKWLDKPITLEIDHIDGNWLNDTKENLQFLCPNCHSDKTKTEAAHRRKTRTSRYIKVSSRTAEIKMCCGCGNRIALKSTTCQRCRQRPTKISWPDLSVLENAKRRRKISTLAMNLGVSDNAIHKRIKRLKYFK